MSAAQSSSSSSGAGSPLRGLGEEAQGWLVMREATAAAVVTNFAAAGVKDTSLNGTSVAQRVMLNLYNSRLIYRIEAINQG